MVIMCVMTVIEKVSTVLLLYVYMKKGKKNAIKILEKMMSMSFCHMHGPEHHIMVGAALLTAYKNAGGNIDLNKALFRNV